MRAGIPLYPALSLEASLSLGLIHVSVIHWAGQLVHPTVSKVVDNQKEKVLAVQRSILHTLLDVAVKKTMCVFRCPSSLSCFISVAPQIGTSFSLW